MSIQDATFEIAYDSATERLSLISNPHPLPQQSNFAASAGRAELLHGVLS